MVSVSVYIAPSPAPHLKYSSSTLAPTLHHTSVVLLRRVFKRKPVQNCVPATGYKSCMLYCCCLQNAKPEMLQFLQELRKVKMGGTEDIILLYSKAATPEIPFC